MAKIALLIGISDYGDGLPQLSGTQKDLEAMERVLKDPQVGAFDRVEVLANPNRTQMERAIEALFSQSCSRDDLILLYFSGHGIRDDQGRLYLAAQNTERTAQGGVFVSTAVSSVAMQGYMGQSRSKRQVLILDCCFSGAFAKDMTAKGEEPIDIKAQLGSEGRAVLTSSTATQVSYEQDGASIYTRYLVQGLETGAADQNEDGQITADELHNYAREKVQEASPSMRPEIYAAREGYNIIVARAPQGDPKLVYRKEFNERAKLKRGKLSRLDLRALKVQQRELGLTAAEAEQISTDVLQPYNEFWQKLNEFEQAVQEAQDDDPQWTQEAIDDLKYFQRVLKLRDEDVDPVLERQSVSLTGVSAPTPVAQVPQKAAVTSVNHSGRLSTPAPADIPLQSEKGVDYTKLRDLLTTGDWQGADNETSSRMLEAVGRKDGDWMRAEELRNFPCTDLKTIDRLWVQYSQGHFGFSVQKDIYVACGATLDGEYPGGKTLHEFCNRVGWKVYGQYIPYSSVVFGTEAPKAHLPFAWHRGFKIIPSLMKKGNWLFKGAYLFEDISSSLLVDRDDRVVSLLSRQDV